MTVIEADGIYTTPTPCDSFQITAGQRYSFLLDTSSHPIENYWIRAKMEDMYTPAGSDISNGLNLETRAILRYDSSPNEEPANTKPPRSRDPLNVYFLGELNGLTTQSKPPPTRELTLHFWVAGNPADMNETIATFTLDSDSQRFDRKQYRVPQGSPTLKDVLLFGEDRSVMGSANAVPVVNGEWVSILVVNDDNVDHTFHLHGHSFYVLSAGTLRQPIPPKREPAKITTYPRRDSIQVPACQGHAEGNCVQGFVTL
ncbi:laccase, partial [Podochytrium sp. JEL0797]